MSTQVSPVLEAASVQTGEALRLNLGGAGEGNNDAKIPGFLTVDLREVPDTDIVSNVRDLRMFKDGTVDEIYASNVLEHFPHTDTVDVLKEWRRVLKKGGLLRVSVPDFDASVRVYLKNGLLPWVQYLIWGDQKHELNFHYINFTWPLLAQCLAKAGFQDAKRVDFFPYAIKDASSLLDSRDLKPISLNVEAVA